MSDGPAVRTSTPFWNSTHRDIYTRKVKKIEPASTIIAQQEHTLFARQHAKFTKGSNNNKRRNNEVDQDSLSKSNQSEEWWFPGFKTTFTEAQGIISRISHRSSKFEFASNDWSSSTFLPLQRNTCARWRYVENWYVLYCERILNFSSQEKIHEVWAMRYHSSWLTPPLSPLHTLGWTDNILLNGAPVEAEWWGEESLVLRTRDDEETMEWSSSDNDSASKGGPKFHNCGFTAWGLGRTEWRKQTVATRPPKPAPVRLDQVARGIRHGSRQFDLPGPMKLKDLIDVYTEVWDCDSDPWWLYPQWGRFTNKRLHEKSMSDRLDMDLFE